jgi:DNA-binding MarR family transcriptional regulator
VAEHQIGFLLQRAHRRLRAAHNDALLPLELTIAHVAVLGLVASKGALTQSQLIEIMGVDKSAMVYLIDEIERQALVERRPAPGDRRANAVHLTELGRKRLVTAGAVVAKVEDDFLSPLGVRDRATLARLLDDLVGSSSPKRGTK